MRIIFVSWEFPPAFGGGIGTYVDAITRVLAGQGHEVTVVSVTDRPTPVRELTSEGVRVLRLPVPAHQGSDPGATLRVWQTRADQVHAALAGLLRGGRADLIEFADYRGEGVTFLSSTAPSQRPPCVVKLHTPLVVLNRYNTHRRSPAVLEAFENEAMLLADRLVSPSRVLADEVRSGVAGLRERAIDIHPYPLDWRFAQLGAENPEPVGKDVLYVGRLEERKGVESLVRAACAFLPRCEGATLRLVGGDTALSAREPSMRAVLETQIPADLAPRVIFEPPRPREQLVRLYRSARVCVFPSLFENFPNVCLEAMALGRPVVAGSNTGMAEMIEDGTSGRIFPSGDSDALARSVHEVWSWPQERREAMGRAARARVLEAYEPGAIGRAFAALTERYGHAQPDAGDAPAPRRSRPARVRSVACVIPCYNHGEFLDEAVASVRAQRTSVEEIVIVDDGSTDAETIEAAQRAAARHGARLIRQENKGLAEARNTGVRATSSEYFFALDSDDRVTDDFVEQLLAPLANDPTLGYAYCQVRYFGAHEGTWECPPYDPARLLIENMSTATALVRREAFDAAGGYSPDMVHGFEDWDFWLALLAHGWHGRLVPRVMFEYRKHAGGSMLTRTQERRGEMVARMIQHHRGLYDRLLTYAVTEKDRMFFREHMELWRLRETLARVGHLASVAPPDQPVGGVGPPPVDMELALIEGSRAWRAVSSLKNNPIYEAIARARWGPDWKLQEAKESPEQRLYRIKKSRSFRLIESLKRTSLYRKYGGRGR